MDIKNKLIGNPNQVTKARRITFRDGVADGVKAIEFHNSKGLYVTCIEDQCLNIFDFSYNGLVVLLHDKQILFWNLP